MTVFVLDKRHLPLMPCSSRRAHRLLSSGRARIHKYTPFKIRLVDRQLSDSTLQQLRLKLDPGSQATGMALVRQGPQRSTVVALFEIKHRGAYISKKLTARRGMRHARRARKTRYRPARFSNRRNQRKGWLAPSLLHRVHTTLAWVRKLIRSAPVGALSSELVRFDMQLMQNTAISGMQYQQGELQGYEIREYLLEKWDRKCAYCDVKDTPLEVEHIVARSMGGSHRVSNLTLSCRACNQRKGAQSVQLLLAADKKRLQHVVSRCRAPLRDAAAVNATRWRLLDELKLTGLPVETGSGGLTKYNRCRLGIPKSHALDAACVGNVTALKNWKISTRSIVCTGRGSYQRTRLTKDGFPRGYLMRKKKVHGFQTGDRVQATVLKGKKVGSYLGRVAVRASGSFNMQTAHGVIQGIGWRCCKILQRNDGYGYNISHVDRLLVVSSPAQPQRRGISEPIG